MSVLRIRAANQRYIAAAGLRPGPPLQGNRANLAWTLAARHEKGGYFLEIGGHAVAVFIASKVKTFASYEQRRRLYYFDPNVGCYYSEEDATFDERFSLLDAKHRQQNPNYDPSHWDYFSAEDVRALSDVGDADMDVSSLFQ